MFLRKLRVQKLAAQEQPTEQAQSPDRAMQRVPVQGDPTQLQDCPIHWIDTFAMRNFTNDAVFDDTLPVEDGVMEAGHRVPLERLRVAMEDWLRRKGFVKTGEELRVTEISRTEEK